MGFNGFKRFTLSRQKAPRHYWKPRQYKENVPVQLVSWRTIGWAWESLPLMTSLNIMPTRGLRLQHWNISFDWSKLVLFLTILLRTVDNRNGHAFMISTSVVQARRSAVGATHHQYIPNVRLRTRRTTRQSSVAVDNEVWNNFFVYEICAFIDRSCLTWFLRAHLLLSALLLRTPV